jgi:hypothetical protein
MGIPTLISTSTPSGVGNADITSGIDSTYDEYMFVLTNMSQSAYAEFGVQFNVDGQSGFNEVITSTFFRANHYHTNDNTSFGYVTAGDQAQGTAYQRLSENWGSDSGLTHAGILHLFTPSNTTFVTHFYYRAQENYGTNATMDNFMAGYVNATGAIDEISFKVASGTFSGTIQMYGIS